MKPGVLVAAAALLLAGCGGGDENTGNTVTATPTVPPAETKEVRVYWLSDGKVWPALREVVSGAVGAQALNELSRGPTAQEAADLQFSSAVPEGVSFQVITANRVAELGSSMELPEKALAQVVYTLTQFPTVESVKIDGQKYTRADFEDLTPAILVESPLPFEEVESPLRVTGTANTFEANFQYTLTDTDGLIVDEGFVSATSGTGTRGTFDFTTDPFTVPFDGVGSLSVFESSAKDGSRINLVEIPLRMRR